MQLIGISGSSCSGKTTLTKALAEQYGVTVISLDDFFKQIEDYARTADGEIDFDHPDNILWDEFVGVIESLQRGETAMVPIYEKGFGKGRMGFKEVKPSDIIVVEGYLLFHHPVARELFNKEDRVFLDLPSDLQRTRRVETYAFMGLDASHAEIVMETFTRLVEPTKEFAGEIIDASMSIEQVREAFLSRYRIGLES